MLLALPVLPYLLHIGPLHIPSFGVVLALTFFLTGRLYELELERRGVDPARAGDVLTAAVVGGILGAKLYYHLEHWDELLADPRGQLFSGAGLVAYGGYAGGILLSYIVLRRKGAPILTCFDGAAPLLALGYALGRIGCFLAGDGDYGPPSDLPWAMAFPHGVVPTAERVHPTPLYELVLMLGVFALLWRLRLRPWPPGRLFALYLVLQGTERFAIEYWRVNPDWILGLSGAQVVAAASIAFGAIWLWRGAQQ